MLVIIVIICNLFIVIINLYVAWKICRIKIWLSKTADVFVDLEENLALILKESSLLILETALEINKVNNQYQLLKKRQQKVQQILLIARFSYQVWKQKFS
jgi:hypothetical protein